MVVLMVVLMVEPMAVLTVEPMAVPMVKRLVQREPQVQLEPPVQL
jgi:hypothetical protein